MKISQIILVVLTIFSSCITEVKGVKNISVRDLKVRLTENKNIQLVDVRTTRECANGTIGNALEIDVTAKKFEQQAIKNLDKAKPVYVYCRSGGRSLIAAKILVNKGYKVYNIEGGYIDWLDKNK